MAELTPIADAHSTRDVDQDVVRWDVHPWAATLVVGADGGQLLVTLTTGPDWPAQGLVIRTVTPAQLRQLAAALTGIADREEARRG